MRTTTGLSSLAFLGMAIALLTGCGVPGAEHAAVIAERDSLRVTATAASLEAEKIQGELKSVGTTLDTTKADLVAVQTALATAQEKVAQVGVALATAESGLASAQAQTKDLGGQLAIVKRNNESLTADNNSLNARIPTLTYLPYRDPAGGLSLDYPTTWVKTPTNSQSPILVSYASQDSSASVVVVREELPQEISTASYFTATSQQLAARGYALTSSSDMAITGRSAIKGIFIGGNGAQVLLVTSVRDRTAYAAIFTTLTSRVFEWGLTFSEMVKSLNFPPATVTATPTTQATQTAATATPSQAVATATSRAVLSGTPDPSKTRPLPVLATPMPNPNARYGGTFRWLTSQDPVTFGIWDSSNNTSLAPSIPITDSLLERNEFETGKNDQILPNLAYDWWTDDAGTTWTFKLRQGAVFTDGAELTCADVEFSLKTIRDGLDAKGAELLSSPRGSYLRRATGITCPDKHTVQVKTDGPLMSLPATLALSSMAIMPKHVYEGNLRLWNNQALKVGVGPYTLKEYKPSEAYRLARNASYWNRPYPLLDGLDIINIGSVTAVNAAMRVGRAEYGGTSLSKANRDQMEAEGKVYVAGKGAGDGFFGLSVNFKKAPWSDSRFALAVRCAIDSAQVIQAESSDGFEGPVAPLADTPGGPSWGITKEEWKAIGPCFGPTAETNMSERQQIARDLLSQIGFLTSNPARPTVLWPSAGAPSTWQTIQTQLQAVGIQPSVQMLSVADVYAKILQGEFAIGTPTTGFVTSRRDPDHWFYEQFYSTSDRNYSFYRNPEADALIDRQSRTLDPTERTRLIRQTIVLLTKESAKIVIRHSYMAYPLAIWVRDMHWGQPGNQNTSMKMTRAWLDIAKMKEVLGQ